MGPQSPAYRYRGNFVAHLRHERGPDYAPFATIGDLRAAVPEHRMRHANPANAAAGAAGAVTVK